MKEFNELLKEIGLSRRQFAEMIGITYESMNVMLSKDNEPKWVKSALIVARKLKGETI
jgi:DNA-binding XRE family transcriptional regulator